MSDQNAAEIVSIGSELLMGEITDTNAVYLASELRLLGIRLNRINVVGDDRKELSEVLRQSLNRSALIITSGGLGPTEDDLTRECLADVLEERLAVDPELEKHLTAFFLRLNREMPASNVRQAMLIPSAEPLPNEQGTAPGWWVEKNGKVIVALPGPPGELKQIWEKEVKHHLRSKFPGTSIFARTLKTFGLSEAKVGEMVKPFFSLTNPLIGIYAKPDGIHIRLIARGKKAGELLEITEKQIEEVLSGHIWGKDQDELQESIGKLLAQKGLTLATVEDGTRGLLASMITSVEGSAVYYRGGLVAWPDETKIALGLSPDLIGKYGAISAEVARVMAIMARDRFQAELGLSTTGIAGLDSPESQTPGLSYIGLADRRGEMTWPQRNLPFRHDIRNQEAIAALFRLRERLIER